MSWRVLRKLIAVIVAAASSGSQGADCPCAQEATPTAAAKPERLNVEVGNAPSLGPANAPVTLIVFSDFECGFCARGAETAREIVKRFGDQVRFVFKHNPLPGHPHARLAATAAQAAHEQGKFWEMHALIFRNQSELDQPSLERYAQQAGLDVSAFKESLASGRPEAAVAQDIEQARSLSIQGTPTFFVNGRIVQGAQPMEVLANLITNELTPPLRLGEGRGEGSK